MSTLLDHETPLPTARTPPAPDPRPPDPNPPDTLDVGSIHAAVVRATREGDTVSSEKGLIDQIRELEKLGHAVAALQADRIRRFARAHAATRVDLEGDELDGDGLDPAKLERSITAQIALACGISPTRGRTRLRTARDLHRGLDRVREAFTTGALSTEKTTAITGAATDLDDHQRSRLDQQLAGHQLAKLGLGRLRDLVRTLAATVAPEKFRARARTALSNRRVTLRPGDDGMCWLTAHLPIEQGAAALAALTTAVTALWADPTAVVTRSKGQTMADTLVERLTGQATAEAVNTEIQAILPIEALLDPDADPDTAPPAQIPGLGPIPVERLLTHRAGRLTLRRLLTRRGIIIGGDSRTRRFTGVLAELLRARDAHRCREPYCDAPIRHIDHITRNTDHGHTEFDNGRGTCEFHNYVREQAGWTVHTTDDGIQTTTPTGHTYTSPTPTVA